MVAAIAAHDFINARRYSDEEIRLKNFMHDLQNKASTGHVTSLTKNLRPALRR